MESFDLNNMPDWARGLNCAVTICDRDGIVVYQNNLSSETFGKHGSMVGRSLIPCHSERSRSIIADMFATGRSNAYTITKGGRRKLIYQTPWRDADGNICGLVELSMVIPDDMPHYDRDAVKA